jgi:diketogulonate reductase-like aldo/keto reductase
VTNNDWRADVLKSLPDEKQVRRYITFTSGLELIDTAAYNRRMLTEEFVGRAALAVAAYDAEELWAVVTQKEPPLRDARRRRLPAKRLYGKNFGNWQIEGMK